jgi:rhamnosyltransferase
MTPLTQTWPGGTISVMAPEPRIPELTGLCLQIGKTYLNGPHWLLSRPNLPDRAALLPHEFIGPFNPLPFPAQFFDFILADPYQLTDLNPLTTLANWRKVARQWVALDYSHPDLTLTSDWEQKNLLRLAQTLGWNCKTVDGWWLLEAAPPIPLSQQIFSWARSPQRRPGHLLSLGAMALGLTTSSDLLHWAVLAGWLLFSGLWLWRTRMQPLQLEWLRQPLPPHLQDPTCRERICAVIITYNPSPSLIDNLYQLLPQVKTILLIDNASTQGSAVLEEAAHMPGVVWLPNTTNLGLGAALNNAATYALEHGFEWLATFDQDSRVTPHYFERLLAAHKEKTQSEKIGLLMGRPMIPITSTLKPLSGIPAYRTQTQSPLSTIITSGNLVSSRALAQVRWNEALFIDSVDHDYNLQLLRKGYSMALGMRTFMLHQVNADPGRKLERHQKINSSRTYYQVRNTTTLLGWYGLQHPRLALHWLTRVTRTLLSSLRPDRRLVRQFAWQGLRDALRGRLGPYSGD